MNIFSTIFTDNFLGAIFSTIFIILLGYFLRKKNLVNDTAGKTLSNILLSAALPALAFNAFMTDINDQTFSVGMNVLVFGFVAYVLLILFSKIIYFKYKGDLKTTMVVLTAFGSTTFFGIPIINGLLGSQGTLYANIFNIAYRVFLYSYGLIAMSGLKFEKKNLKQIFLNPIIITTFLGLFIWIFQASLPTVTIKQEISNPAIQTEQVLKVLNDKGKDLSDFSSITDDITTAISTKKVIEKQVPFARIDLTLPWVFQGLKYLGSLSSPLAWLAIGMTLANISLEEALKDKRTLIYGFVKLLMMPAIFIVILLLANSLSINFSYEAITAITIMLATPPATVAVAYAIKFEKEQVLASNLSLVNSVLAVFAIAFWAFACQIMHINGIF